MMKTSRLPALALAALLLGGCASPYARHVSGPGADEVEIEDVRTDRENGRLSAQVTLRNDDDDPIRLRYRFTWLDAKGMAVGTGSPTDAWLTLSLAPYELRYLRASAPNAECADFRLYLQELE